MKVLKVILIVILSLFLIYVILGFIGPKDARVERTVMIEAPPAVVFPYVSEFEKQNAWGPWLEADSAAMTSIEGQDGTEGAVSRWEGNDQVGKGSQTLTRVAPDSVVESHLVFEEPRAGEADAYFHLKPVEKGTEVTWGLFTEFGFFERPFMLVMDFDAMLGAEYEKGLNNLKQLVESNKSKEYNGYKVEVVDWEGRNFMGKKATLKFDEMQDYFATTYGDVGQKLGAAGAQMEGMPVGLYYSWDEENQQTELAAAMGYSGEVDIPEGLEKFEVPAGKALMIEFYGDYEGLGDAHEAMDAYIKEHNIEVKSPVMEEYVTDPGTAPENPEKWLTKVYYFL